MSDQSTGREIVYALRGDNYKLYTATDHDVILAGPSETGKTVAACLKCHSIASCVPGAQGAIGRKTSASLVGTVLRTFGRVIENDVKCGFVRIYGGETPSRYIYANGSTIWTLGLDNTDSSLSAERDFIYINQSEELTENDWEVLSTRCTGRAAVVQHPQLFGDCNPSSRMHWIRDRSKRGDLRLLNATHLDNPSLYDSNGNITEQGQRSMAVLDKLTGVRKLRLRDGIWATAEGAVYSMFDVNIHVCERNPKEMKTWYLAMDFGFTDPMVILLIGSDSDRRWHIFREFYESGVIPEDVVALASAWNDEKVCECAAVDAAAAGLIASLQSAGVNAIGGKGTIDDGIALVTNRLKIQTKDTSDNHPLGRPRLTVDKSCVNTINEFESYQWKPTKDVPIDKDNHSMDAIRYLENVLAVGTGSFNTYSTIHLPATTIGRVFAPRQFTPRAGR